MKTGRIQGTTGTTQALRDHFVSLLENHPLPAFIIDIEAGDPADYRFLMANRAACELYGYTLEEFLSLPLGRLRPGEDIQQFREAIRRGTDSRTGSFRTPQPQRHLKKDGSLLHVDVFAERISFEGKTCNLAIVQDVTEAVDARADLRESEERYRLLVERNPGGVYLLREGIILFANQRLAEIAGRSQEDLIGRPLKDLVHPDDWPSMAGYIRKRVHGELGAREYSFRALRPDGSVVDLEAHGELMVDHGTPVFLGTILDVTERKMAEEGLRLFSTAVEVARDGVQLVDLDGRIFYSNRAVERIFGYACEDLQGRRVSELNLDPEMVDREILPAIVERGHWSGEMTVRHREGYTFPILLSASEVLSDEGEPLAIVAIFRDISDLKQAEASVQQAYHELELKNRDLEAFVYTAAHDLRTPLISVLGYVALLRKEMEGAPSRRQRTLLQRIVASVSRFDELLSDLLEYARAGVAGGDRQAVAVEDLVKRVLEEENVADREERPRIVIHGDLPFLHMRESRAYQVYRNLLSNCLKFGRAGSPLVIEVGMGRKEGEPLPEDHALFFVRDNGVGIEDRLHEEVFGLFTRSGDAPSEGTGVGLAIVKRIVEGEGGSVWLDSVRGKGTTLYFTLPVIEVFEGRPGGREPAASL